MYSLSGISSNISIKDPNRKEKIDFRRKLNYQKELTTQKGLSDYIANNPKTPEYLIEDIIKFHFLNNPKILTEEQTKKVKKIMLQIFLQALVTRAKETKALLKTTNEFLVNNKEYLTKEKDILKDDTVIVSSNDDSKSKTEPKKFKTQ